MKLDMTRFLLFLAPVTTDDNNSRNRIISSSQVNYSRICIRGIFSLVSRVRTAFRKFWKVIEIENAIFRDLKSFGKEMIFL